MSDMDVMQSYPDTDIEDSTGPIEELDASAEDEFLHEEIGLHLFSKMTDHYKGGMRPDAVCAETVHHATFIPDYPVSSEKGYAYVIRTDGLPSKDIAKPWLAIQYRVRWNGSPKPVNSAFLSSFPCMMHKFVCNGAKHCKHIDPSLMAHHYDVGTLSYGEDRKAIQAKYMGANNVEQKAVEWAWDVVAQYQNGKACTDGFHTASCKPELKRARHPTPAGTYQSVVQCCHKSDDDKTCRHHRVWVPRDYDGEEPSLQIMNKIFNNHNLRHTKTEGHPCFQVNEVAKTTKTCAGKHTHPPPPNTRIQPDLKWNLKSSIEQSAEERHYSTGGLVSYMGSHAYRVFLDSYNAESLSQIHPALANDDRIRHLIVIHKAIHAGGRRGREAVQNEWTLRHRTPNTAYIQEFIDDGDGFLAICFSQGMCKLWEECKTFQLDMNYKRVRGKKEHEIIFATRAAESFASRAFMSGESAKDYCRLFKALFDSLERRGVSIKWMYAEGEGLSGVTLDQDAGCIKGVS
ncbi:uncharacterized protein CPUR_08387 [Claviceps purpurea 20.1]|uniref:Uncharacterized protein n=1 Tax=Claviceps purpurea (strain 20.1) TaxID=1111077 RepID=M1WCX7_CLAP2|nr:uncharacterized protein CPUR_08387 [Claviceps purpurea 20.1]